MKRNGLLLALFVIGLLALPGLQSNCLAAPSFESYVSGSSYVGVDSTGQFTLLGFTNSPESPDLVLSYSFTGAPGSFKTIPNNATTPVTYNNKGSNFNLYLDLTNTKTSTVYTLSQNSFAHSSGNGFAIWWNPSAFSTVVSATATPIPASALLLGSGLLGLIGFGVRRKQLA